MKFVRRLKELLKCRWYSAFQQAELNNKKAIANKVSMPEPVFNLDYLCNPANRDEIFKNIQMRKGVGDIDKILELSQLPQSKLSLMRELSQIPNCTDPTIVEYKDKGCVLREHGQKMVFEVETYDFGTITERMHLIRTSTLGPLTGQRGYILLGDLAELEQALIHYTMNKLIRRGFKLVSVPDIIPTKLIERCGLITDKGRTLVYSLEPCYGDDMSLSGTAEMSLAGRLLNTELSQEELPLKMAAVSRCYRAETSSIAEERGIYRVHQFTKVEMFVCCEQEKSVQEFGNLLTIQEEIFSSLGLHFQVLDMPPHELGAPAYRKIDIEGWMPGKGKYGELSSCSNCTDYQARRLNITYKKTNGEVAHVHTLNGTACAIPRTLIAICETHQTASKVIQIPECLVPYMKNRTTISKQDVPVVKKNKHKATLK